MPRHAKLSAHRLRPRRPGAAAPARWTDILEPRLLFSTYYISPTGSDANAGTSQDAPWKTPANVNALNLDPGDQVLFQGGATFDAPTATNLLSNPGFESDFTNWTENFDGSGNSTITTTTSAVHTGTKAAQVVGATKGGRGQVVTSLLQPNHTYTVRFWAKINNTNTWSGAGLTIKKSGSTVAAASVAINSVGAYTQYSFTITAPASFDYADLWFIKSPDAGGLAATVLNVDDFSLIDTTSNTLTLDATDAGTADNPVIIGTYGTGRATLRAGDNAGILLNDVGGINISHLALVGSGSSTNTADGISAYTDVAGQRTSHVYIDDVDVSGFGKKGITIGSWDSRYQYYDALATQGYDDVRVTYTSAHDNGQAGIYAWGQTITSNTNIYFGHCTASYNGADGLLIADTDGGTIERSMADHNGNAATSDGRVGIWAYDSNNITIQYNESYANQTNGIHDGGGFDLDGGVTNSVLQYNYSHDNAGAGYLLGEYQGSKSTTNNTIRYNISQNDGQKNSYAGIYVYNYNRSSTHLVTSNWIYNNTVYNSSGGANLILEGNLTGDANGSVNTLANNIFVTTGGVYLIRAAAGSSGVRLVGNDYWTSGGAFNVKWGSTTCTSLATWLAAASTQERLSGNIVALTLDPGLTSPGTGATIANSDQLSTLSAYKLTGTSGMISAGQNLATLYGIVTGASDFYGNSLPIGGAYEVGADEYNFPTVYTGSAGNDTYTVKLAPDGRTLQVYASADTTGQPPYSIDNSKVSSLSFDLGDGNDTVIIDASNGQPIGSRGLSFSGGSGADLLTLSGGTYWLGSALFSGSTSISLVIGGDAPTSPTADLTVCVNADATVNFGDPPAGAPAAPMSLDGTGGMLFAAVAPPPPTPTPLGTGLLGHYYASDTLTKLKLTRVDPALRFDWGRGSPAPSLPKDRFSILWTGELAVPQSDLYTFYAQANDGVRMWIDGQLVINRWSKTDVVRENSAAIRLSAAARHQVVLAYMESTGDAKFNLTWSSPTIARSAIPTQDLFPVDLPVPTTTLPVAPTKVARPRTTWLTTADPRVQPRQ